MDVSLICVKSVGALGPDTYIIVLPVEYSAPRGLNLSREKKRQSIN
jgi:hypothetical protein